VKDISSSRLQYWARQYDIVTTVVPWIWIVPAAAAVTVQHRPTVASQADDSSQEKKLKPLLASAPSTRAASAAAASGGGGSGGFGPKALATLVCTTAPMREARINPFVGMVVRGVEDLMKFVVGAPSRAPAAAARPPIACSIAIATITVIRARCTIFFFCKGASKITPAGGGYRRLQTSPGPAIN
jgi:hypothetical protein